MRLKEGFEGGREGRGGEGGREGLRHDPHLLLHTWEDLPRGSCANEVIPCGCLDLDMEGTSRKGCTCMLHHLDSVLILTHCTHCSREQRHICRSATFCVTVTDYVNTVSEVTYCV